MTHTAYVGTPPTEGTASVDYRRLYEEALEKTAAQAAQAESLRKENRALRLRGAPMPGSGHEWLANLQYKVKSLGSRVAAFESGEKYEDMKAAFKAQLAEKDREIRKLKAELADSNSRIVTMREKWSQVFEDMEKEQARELKKRARELKEMEERALGAERRLDEAKDKLLEKTRELYEARTELEEERDKNQALKAQMKRTHENSSKPSSTIPNRGKITNNRVRSGKRPGGQAGHEHHPRKMHTPTSKVEIPAPPEYADSPDYVPTGKTIVKQLVDIRVEVITTEYSTPEFRNVRTGERVHAEFPGGLALDVTYSGNVKALAFLLNNYCNVSIGRASELLSELTQGELEMSTGMINGLSGAFSRKTEAEQERAFADMLLAPVMNVDFTTATVNGEQMSVTVCATPDNVMYLAREHKGHEGVKGSPAETFRGTLVHDHESTFYKYGDAHQECLDHVLRYLQDSILNEGKLKWNARMRDLVREMIHFRKHLDPEDPRDPDKIDPESVARFEALYDEILGQAKEEYGYEPPGKYGYKKGYNLYLRMERLKAEHTLFLHDRNVPYSNSLCERMGRVFKRKQHQVMAFRSFGGLDKLCDALGVVATLRESGKNLYESVAAIFDMPESRDKGTAI